MRQHQTDGFDQTAPADAGVRLAVAVEFGSQALRHPGAQQAHHSHRHQAELPIAQQRQRRHHRARQHAAQGHTGLLDGKHQRHLVLGCGAGQQVRAGRCDRAITQPNQHRAQHHGRQPGHRAQKQAQGTQDQAPLAHADRPHAGDRGAAHQGGHHGAGISHRHVQAHQGGRDLQSLRHHRGDHGQAQQGHGDHGLDHQGQQQRPPVFHRFISRTGEKTPRGPQRSHPSINWL